MSALSLPVRDDVVRRACAGSTWKGVRYTATTDTVYGCLPPGTENINHGIAQDVNG